jgi:hypothetical protein
VYLFGGVCLLCEKTEFQQVNSCIVVEYEFRIFEVNLLRSVKGKSSLCLTNEAQCLEDVWGSGGIDPCILDLGNTWS